MEIRKPNFIIRGIDMISRIILVVFYLVLAIAIVVCAPRGLYEVFFHDFESDMRAPVSEFGLGHYRFIKSHLEEPFEDYSEAQTFIIPFKAVALSNMACGLMNLYSVKPEMKAEITPLIAEIARRALLPKVSIYGFDPRTVKELANEGMYLSHLNLILGCYRHITGDDRYDSFHIRVSSHLAEMALRDSDFTAQSFSGANKWPADHTVLLCSLYLFDKTHGTDISKAPIEGWLAYMKDHATDSATGLPHSEITNMTHGRLPRVDWPMDEIKNFPELSVENPPADDAC